MTTKPRHLVCKGGRYYWQPSKSLRAAGWRIQRLSSDPMAAAGEAERLNAELDAWRGGHRPAHAPPERDPSRPKVKPVGRRPASGHSGVYLVRTEGAEAFKVGLATDPVQRLVALQTGNPSVLRLAFFVQLPFETAKKVEAAAHELLAQYQRRSEWFVVPVGVRPELVLMELVRSILAGGVPRNDHPKSAVSDVQT
jgi:hypothetical protein